MKKLILIVAIVVIILNLASNIIHKPTLPIPEFDDNLNNQICIEEELY